MQALNGNPARQQAWESFAAQVLDTRRGGVEQLQVAHFMRAEVAQAAREAGGEPVQVVTASAKRILHADSPRHQRLGTAPARADILRLPELLDQAETVLWDSAHNNLVYLCPAQEDGKVLKIVVDVPMRPKDAKGLAKAGRFDAMVNAMVVEESGMRPVGGSQFSVVWAKK